MAAPKKLTRLAGDDLALKQGANPAQHPNLTVLALAVDQLQKTVNEVITRFNAHTHVENTAGAYAQNANTAAPAAGQKVQAIDVAATNLFVAAAS